MTIRIKYTNSWYGYAGHDGYALLINGKKMHSGLFVSVQSLRKYWNEYHPMLLADIIPAIYQ